MPIYIFARLDPHPGKELQVRDALMRVLAPTRAEPGCLRIHVYQSTRGPAAFYIHSAWVDEPAFEAHVELPHTQHFIAAVAGLLAHPLQALRTRQLAW